MSGISSIAAKGPRKRLYRWIKFPRHEAVLSEIFAAIEDQQSNGSETVIMLSGPRGMGKSLLGRELEHRAHERCDHLKPVGEMLPRPVLRAMLGSGAGFASVVVDIRHFQGMPVPTSHYRAAHFKIVETCRLQQTRCIFIDRFEMVLDQGAVAQRDALKAIGYLAAATGLPIVLCGAFDPRRVFTRTNDIHGFVEDRALYIDIPRWAFDDQFRAAVLHVATMYNAPDPEALADVKMAEQLHLLSHGITRHLARGLWRGLRLAREDGLNSLKQRHIEAGFAAFSPPPRQARTP